MDTVAVSIINCLFCWSVAALAVGGYFITRKRLGEKWPFWIVLGIGWTFLAAFETLLAFGISLVNLQSASIWLASYLLVMTSLLLIFLKFIQMKSRG